MIRARYKVDSVIFSDENNKGVADVTLGKLKIHKESEGTHLCPSKIEFRVALEDADSFLSIKIQDKTLFMHFDFDE